MLPEINMTMSARLILPADGCPGEHAEVPDMAARKPRS
jgi:hypothetical protein